MKDLKSKIMALMLVIPLLLIFTTSSVVKITSVLVDVPVSGVEILGEDTLTVDLAEEDNTVTLQTAVYPEGATNKAVVFSSEAVEGTAKADVLISETGVVTPLSTGTVKLIATAGGRTASVQLVVYSSRVAGVTQISGSFNLREGETYTFKNGRDYSVSPEGLDYTAVWTSGNAAVATVDKYTGLVTARLAGSSVISAAISGIEINKETGERTEKTYALSYALTVGAAPTETGISFGGSAEATKLALTSTAFDFSYDETKTAAYGELRLDYDTDEISSASITLGTDGTGRISATLNADAPENATYAIKVLKHDFSLITTVYVTKAVMTHAEISLDKTTYKVRKNAQEFVFGVTTDSYSESAYTVIYSSSDPTVVSVQSIANECYATALKEGTASISATVKKKNGEPLAVVVAPVTLTVVNPYAVLTLAENSASYGLGKEFAFGGYSLVNGTKTAETYSFGLKGRLSSENTVSVLPNVENGKLIWTSSDESVASISNGVLSLSGKAGVVTVTVASVYNALLGENVSASFKINCLPAGVNVRTYDDLVYCSSNATVAVLQSDIMLAPVLSNPDYTGYKNYLDNVCTTKMKTTADDSYYVNNGAAGDAYVRYCLELTADVYGNGHFIDGNYITRSNALYGYTVFRGPLDIVRITYDNSSEQNAAVKAQDNIVFLVKRDNITLTNVELKGCSDGAIAGDLSNLNKCGTVLEIVGDGCTVSYSRVNNGRTAVRMFGTSAASESAVNAAPDDYRVSGTITNCIISYGREFLLKLGSNQSRKNASVSGMLSGHSATDADYLAAAPYLTNRDGASYDVNGTKDGYFYDNYVMTDLTLNDSVFCNAGLFCVGLESKFAGLCLHGWDYSTTYKFGSEKGWGNIAGTSYPAVLRMEGDVRFYDWKKVADVNSETLIEGDPQILNVVGLNMNVSSLIDSYSGSNADKLTVTSGGYKYVNGAIAFYGGGKNYSYVDTTGVASSFNALSKFNIPLSYFGDRVNLIYYSAGKEDFRFLLYDSGSALSLQKQQSDMADNTAYSWVYKK